MGLAGSANSVSDCFGRGLAATKRTPTGRAVLGASSVCGTSRRSGPAVGRASSLRRRTAASSRAAGLATTAASFTGAA